MTARTRARWSVQTRKRLVVGLLFVSPWIVGFSVFTVYPLLSSLYYSFTYYDIVNPPVFVGLREFRNMVTNRYFWPSVGNTVWWVVLAVPAGAVVAFSLALLLNQKTRMRSVFRAIFYIPSIVPFMASALLWGWIYNPIHGLINGVLLRSIGMKGPMWLSSPAWSKPALLFMSLWGAGGSMLVYLAALQDVPQSLYDAASIDGAGSVQRLWHVTIPMVTPAMLYSVLTGMIGAFQYFMPAYVLTNGGPLMSTHFYALELYRNAFQGMRMGLASAMAWVMFVFVIALAILVFKTSARWVYYGGGES